MVVPAAIPLILDTDIGSDIDDCICLSYLLRQQRCELLGVTTVTGPTRQRAAMAEALCRAAGRGDIPVHAGIDRRIGGGIIQPDVPQFEVLAKYPHRKPDDFENYSAVEFLRRTIRARPGEITLLGIGPMTNIGVLFAADPQIPSLLKRLVLMCGVFTTRQPDAGRSEWNAKLDPIATSIVYQSRPPEHISIGLDVTMSCRKPSGECIERFREMGGPFAITADATEVFARNRAFVTFHDPLAAAVIFDREICQYRVGEVSVDAASALAPGGTFFKESDEGPHQVAWEVDAQRFFAHFFDHP
jgi:purine nucleosidase